MDFVLRHVAVGVLPNGFHVSIYIYIYIYKPIYKAMALI